MKLKKKQQQFLIDAHKEVCQEWKTKLENNFPKLFPKVEFEKCKWYFVESTISGCCGFYRGIGYHTPEVISNNGLSSKNPKCVLTSASGDVWNVDGVIRPATDKEVEEALKREAKRRGLEHGNFDSLVSDSYTNVEPINDWYFDECDNILYTAPRGYGGKVVFDNGKWATPIETITKEEAEKELGKKIV